MGEGLPTGSKAKLAAALGEVTEVVRRELAAVKLAHLLPDSRRSK